MLLSKRDESRAPSLHRSSFLLLLSLLLLLSPFFPRKTHLKIYPRFSYPRSPFPPSDPRTRGNSRNNLEDGLLLDLRGFSPVNGGGVGEETGGIKGVRGWEKEERTQRRSPYWRGWRKKHDENAKCNPQSRRCNRARCVQQRRQETMQPSQLRALIELPPTIQPRYLW